MDFTHCGELGVTIGGEPFDHLLFQFILTLGLALCAGVHRQYRERCGSGVPEVSDNLSSSARSARSRLQIPHTTTDCTQTNPYENCLGRHSAGAHPPTSTVDEYTAFRRIGQAQLQGEAARVHLRELPSAPVPEYVSYRTRVRKWSTMDSQQDILGAVIGVEVDVRAHRPDRGVLQAICGGGESHRLSIIVWCAPGAFVSGSRSSPHTRPLAYDACALEGRADVDYDTIAVWSVRSCWSRGLGSTTQWCGSCPRQRLLRYRRSSCPMQWTSVCMTGCLREVRDDDGHAGPQCSGRAYQGAGSSSCRSGGGDRWSLQRVGHADRPFWSRRLRTGGYGEWTGSEGRPSCRRARHIFARAGSGEAQAAACQLPRGTSWIEVSTC